MARKLGTILPTQKSIAINNEYARMSEVKRQAVAVEKLSHCTMRFEQGEFRYYKNPSRYATVGRNDQLIRWFKLRADGYFHFEKWG